VNKTSSYRTIFANYILLYAY